LQMQGNGTFVNTMIPLFNARFQAGFYSANDYCPDKDLFILYPEGIHESERHLRLMQHLGAKSTDASLEFPLYPSDEEDLSALNLPVSTDTYVCVHPGSRGTWRQWPPEHFAALANRCADSGLTVVLTGTTSELPIIHQVAAQLDHPPLIAAGKTSLGAIAVLIRDASALISNCTGVSHIATALKTPSIVISMDGEPERWAPLNRQLHYTIDWTKTPDFNLAAAALERLLNSRNSELREEERLSLKHLPDGV
jgi:ADP-heptose:LPS heptosyltransferase